MEYSGSPSVLALPQRTTWLVFRLLADVVPLSLGYFFYLEISVQVLLLLSLFWRQFETMPTCLFLHPSVNGTYLVAAPGAWEHDRGSGV